MADAARLEPRAHELRERAAHGDDIVVGVWRHDQRARAAAAACAAHGRGAVADGPRRRATCFGLPVARLHMRVTWRCDPRAGELARLGAPVARLETMHVRAYSASQPQPHPCRRSR